MIILGVDPGTTRMGWGVIEKQKPIAYGCIEPIETSAEGRLLIIYRTLIQIVKTHTPQEIAVESIFFSVNTKTAMSVAEARGIVLLVAAQAKIPVMSYTPLVIKQAITGNGKADKTQMQKMIKLLLKLPEIPKPDDTADALAVALTHAVRKRFV